MTDMLFSPSISSLSLSFQVCWLTHSCMIRSRSTTWLNNHLSSSSFSSSTTSLATSSSSEAGAVTMGAFPLNRELGLLDQLHPHPVQLPQHKLCCVLTLVHDSSSSLAAPPSVFPLYLVI